MSHRSSTPFISVKYAIKKKLIPADEGITTEPTEEPFEEPAEEPIEESAQNTIDEPAEEPIEESAQNTIDEPAMNTNELMEMMKKLQEQMNELQKSNTEKNYEIIKLHERIETLENDTVTQNTEHKNDTVTQSESGVSREEFMEFKEYVSVTMKSMSETRDQFQNLCQDFKKRCQNVYNAVDESEKEFDKSRI